MCFSISASFSAAFLLCTLGALSIYKFSSRSTIFFAAFPLLFGIQQFFEGIVWLSLLYPAYASLQKLGVYSFLFFASIIWPIWVPLSLLMLEPHKIRRTLLFFLTSCGIIMAFFLLYKLFINGAQAYRDAHHIVYEIQTDIVWPLSLAYLIPTLLPFFISSLHAMPFFGLVLLISYGVTHYWWHAYSISVWCFFAALISGMVIVILQFLQDHHLNQHTTKHHPH
ncbi:MAG: DUF6629 family protein [Candidatus Babeliaceae bacterium]